MFKPKNRFNTFSKSKLDKVIDILSEAIEKDKMDRHYTKMNDDKEKFRNKKQKNNTNWNARIDW